MSDQIPIRTPDPGYDYRCQRCDHQWRTRRVGDPTPRACAKCRSAYWDRPPREKKEKADAKPKMVRKHKKTGKKRVKKAVEQTARQSPPLPVVRETPPPMESHPAFDQLDSILPPPPHMRRQPYPMAQEYEPTPESQISNKGGKGGGE